MASLEGVPEFGSDAELASPSLSQMPSFAATHGVDFVANPRSLDPLQWDRRRPAHTEQYTAGAGSNAGEYAQARANAAASVSEASASAHEPGGPDREQGSQQRGAWLSSMFRSR